MSLFTLVSASGAACDLPPDTAIASYSVASIAAAMLGRAGTATLAAAVAADKWRADRTTGGGAAGGAAAAAGVSHSELSAAARADPGLAAALGAPNLAALIGEVVGARLISHAGSLVNLAKAPASTIQILGAEKALFRALKTKGNTPKYGLIFHSSFIGRAAAKNKGRISRYLANKCAIASRIDSFADGSTAAFGTKLKDQVEQRLAFYDTGAAPEKNLDVMRGIIASLETKKGGDASEKKKKKKKAEAAAAMDED
jgi:hypothetical protein